MVHDIDWLSWFRSVLHMGNLLKKTNFAGKDISHLHDWGVMTCSPTFYKMDSGGTIQ